MVALSPLSEDKAHPIPSVTVCDVYAPRKEGGARLVVVIASPLDGDSRSLERLMKKIPAASHCNDPRDGKTVRYHILHDRLQQAVREAARKIGAETVITPHVLRHAYATHSRESIEALRKLMGHVSIETTAGYRHAEIDRASNPLDDMSEVCKYLPPANLVR